MDYSHLTKQEIIEGVKNKTINMENLSFDLKNDKDIALEGVKNDINAIKYISPRLQSDKEIILSAFKTRLEILKESTKKQKENYINLTEEQILDGIKNEIIDFQDLPELFRDNKKILLEAIKEQSWAFQYASERLKKDKDVVMKVVDVNIEQFKFASNNLQEDRDILELLEKNSIMTENWIGDSLNWYKEKMEILNSIREKELMIGSIINSNKLNKKNKF